LAGLRPAGTSPSFLVDKDLLTLRPVTAYDVPPPGPKRKRRKRGKHDAYSARAERRPRSEPVLALAATCFQVLEGGGTIAREESSQ